MGNESLWILDLRKLKKYYGQREFREVIDTRDEERVVRGGK